MSAALWTAWKEIPRKQLNYTPLSASLVVVCSFWWWSEFRKQNGPPIEASSSIHERARERAGRFEPTPLIQPLDQVETVQELDQIYLGWPLRNQWSKRLVGEWMERRRALGGDPVALFLFMEGQDNLYSLYTLWAAFTLDEVNLVLDRLQPDDGALVKRLILSSERHDLLFKRMVFEGRSWGIELDTLFESLSENGVAESLEGGDERSLPLLEAALCSGRRWSKTVAAHPLLVQRSDLSKLPLREALWVLPKCDNAQRRWAQVDGRDGLEQALRECAKDDLTQLAVKVPDRRIVEALIEPAGGHLAHVRLVETSRCLFPTVRRSQFESRSDDWVAGNSSVSPELIQKMSPTLYNYLRDGKDMRVAQLEALFSFCRRGSFVAHQKLSNILILELMQRDQEEWHLEGFQAACASAMVNRGGLELTSLLRLIEKSFAEKALQRGALALFGFNIGVVTRTTAYQRWYKEHKDRLEDWLARDPFVQGLRASIGEVDLSIHNLYGAPLEIGGKVREEMVSAHHASPEQTYQKLNQLDAGAVACFFNEFDPIYQPKLAEGWRKSWPKWIKPEERARREALIPARFREGGAASSSQSLKQGDGKSSKK